MSTTTGRSRERHRTSATERVLAHAVLGVFVLAVLVPVGWTVLAALSPLATGEVVLGDLRWANFADAWTQGGLGEALLASAAITAGAVCVQTVLAVLSGYAFGVLGVVGERVVFPVVLLGLMISTEAIVIPLYYQFRGLGLTNSWLGLVLIHVGMGVPFGAFWMRAAFRSTPRAIVEASEIDGAGSFRTLWSVLLPTLRPAVLTLVLLNTMWTWNDYFLGLVFISDPDRQPATLALGAFQQRFTTEFNLLAAAALLICLPVVLLYAVFQRHFISGVLNGAVKD